MTRYREIPAIVTLLAGFITSVILILNEYSLIAFVLIVSLIMVCFFIASLSLVYALNKAADKAEEENKEENMENEETPEGQDIVNDNNVEGVENKDFDINEFEDL